MSTVKASTDPRVTDAAEGALDLLPIPERAAHRSVRGLIDPDSVVVVGASARRSAVVAEAIAGRSRAFLVHPSGESILGEDVYQAIGELPEVPDCAFMLVGHEAILDVMREALTFGVRAFVIPGLGAEAGSRAAEIVPEVLELADSYDAAILGPNCMGMAVPNGGSMWVANVPKSFRRGRVSVIAQSGSIADAMLNCGPRIGFRAVFSTGSEGNRDAADLLMGLAEDEETKAIGLFVETVRRPEAFADGLRACAEAGKPVVCMKVGRSRIAAQAALAHTGAMVGSAKAFTNFVHHHGGIEVTDTSTFMEALEILGQPKWPMGVRLGAISESGGECGMLADAAEPTGLEFPPMPYELVASLQERFPNFLNPQNPLDAWMVDEAEVVFPESLELMALSGEFDILLAQVDITQYRGDAENDWCLAIVRGLAEATKDRRIFPAVTTVHVTDPPRRIANFAASNGVALLRGTRASVEALAAVSTWHPFTSKDLDPHEAIDLTDLLRPGALSEHESAEVMERYGIPMADRRLAEGPEAAVAAAQDLGFPVVVKMNGPAHKASVGGVALGLNSAEEVSVATQAFGGSVLVAQEIAAGPEVICGMTRDPNFGPVIAVGIGGRYAEALSLTATSLAPITHDQAVRLVRKAPGLSKLTNDETFDAIVYTVLVLSRLAVDHPSIVEADINPLILGPNGAVAVDALVVCEQIGTEG
jgi:acetyltransferase